MGSDRETGHGAAHADASVDRFEVSTEDVDTVHCLVDTVYCLSLSPQEPEFTMSTSGWPSPSL